MKHATGMETYTNIYFLFIFNLELIRICKTMLFWLYNLMMSLWKPSILVQVWIKKRIYYLFLNYQAELALVFYIGNFLFCFGYDI